jgi:hypothetical protein
MLTGLRHVAPRLFVVWIYPYVHQISLQDTWENNTER